MPQRAPLRGWLTDRIIAPVLTSLVTKALWAYGLAAAIAFSSFLWGFLRLSMPVWVYTATLGVLLSAGIAALHSAAKRRVGAKALLPSQILFRPEVIGALYWQPPRRKIRGRLLLNIDNRSAFDLEVDQYAVSVYFNGQHEHVGLVTPESMAFPNIPRQETRNLAAQFEWEPDGQDLELIERQHASTGCCNLGLSMKLEAKFRVPEFGDLPIAWLGPGAKIASCSSQWTPLLPAADRHAA